MRLVEIVEYTSEHSQSRFRDLEMFVSDFRV